MDHYICIHGHFYQPRRENPWLEAIELQESAYPYHDWNERITAECYEPNLASHILDSENRVSEIVNNYTRISFDFGPTLLAWMQDAAPQVYQGIIKADKESKNFFSGHGSALALVYNHIIMPLANRRDKHTQVLWGLRDFESRFGRRPEGMWLPETAVDLETLDVMAELGLKFTILSPHQASKVRRIGDTNWDDVSGSRIDTTVAYELHLASGRQINLFFYNDTISRAIAFERSMTKGDNMATRLINAFSDQLNRSQLVHVATDGETFGHHHRNGDMTLAYFLRRIETDPQIKLTNYGEYLALHPPTCEVEIFEKTSWSCVHGIGRWSNDCGCNTGIHPEWNQVWRTPLRQALDWLRDRVGPQYEEKTQQLLKDPWTARDDYIAVILDRSAKNIEEFLNEHATHPLARSERVEVLKLLELQRHAMAMYTSCGWFFDELTGIETEQVIQYAGRVVQLAEELFGDNIEQQFPTLLELAKSNIPEHKDGRFIYERFIKPAIIDLPRVAAHYAISSLFKEYSQENNKIFCYNVETQEYNREDCGARSVVVGRAKVTSEITYESKILSFAVVYFGEHNLSAGVRDYRGKEDYQEILQEITRTYTEADFPGVIRLLKRHFGGSNYSLKSLFRDEQQKVLAGILQPTLTEAISEYRKIYQSYYPLMRFLSDLDNPLPGALRAAGEQVLNNDLRKALTGEILDREAVNKTLNDARSWNIALDYEVPGYIFRQKLETKMADLAARPGDGILLSQLMEAVKLATSVPFMVELRGVQNIYYRLFNTLYSKTRANTKQDSRPDDDWMTQFAKLGETLSMRIA